MYKTHNKASDASIHSHYDPPRDFRSTMGMVGLSLLGLSVYKNETYTVVAEYRPIHAHVTCTQL